MTRTQVSAAQNVIEKKKPGHKIERDKKKRGKPDRA